MKRYLFLLFAFASLAFVLVSCDKDEPNGNEQEKPGEQGLTPAGILVSWCPSHANVLFPDGCRVDEYSITYDGEPVVLDDCDIVLYSSKSTHPNPFSVDVECKISNNATADVFDVIMYDTWVDVLGPEGEGYVETFIYFNGGFIALLSADSGNSATPATKAELYHNGNECIVSSFDVYGLWQNNRTLRCEYYNSPPFEDITEHLEYECDITIGLEVDGKPLTLNITHISPL